MSALATDRFRALFRPALGRKLFIVSGSGLIDRFFLGDLAGTEDIVPALRQLAGAEGYQIILSFDASGQPDLGATEPAWREITEAPTQPRQNDPPMQAFNPARAQTQTNTVGTRERAAVGQTEAQASSALRNLLGRAERAMKSGRKFLLIFSEPEEMCHAPVERETLELLKLVVGLCTMRNAHAESRVVFLVKPGRREDFLRLLNYAAVSTPLTQELDVGGPGAAELNSYLRLQLMLYAEDLRGTLGERERVATEWHQRGELLRSLEQALNGLLLRPERPLRVDSVLALPADTEPPEAVLADLDRMVGLTPVKDRLRGLFKLVEQQTLDRREGRVVRPVNTHMVFLGSPGTGKTEVARLVGRYLRAIGLRTSGAFVEISRSDIASQFNSGDCIQRMREAIQQAMGGVLFVDEAYQLAEGEWMRGALETLMKDMEDRRDSFTVIFAGYEAEMEGLWRVNSGFRSRIPKENVIQFPDYPVEQLQEIFRRECARQQLKLLSESETKAFRYIRFESLQGRFGNARGVRNLVEQIAQSRARLGGGDIQPTMIPEVPHCDLHVVKRLLDELNETLSGTERLQEFLSTLARSAKEAQDRGIPFRDPIHCRFVGPPGTGKTTAARMMGRILHAIGVLSRGHVHEVNPVTDLGSQYVSEYAQRVKQHLELARGGVLFIDEAYQLAEQEQGRQILHQLVQALTAPGFADTVVILAGYRDKMNDLMAVNSGLQRRIDKEIVFDPFPVDALVKLFESKLEDRDYVVLNSDRQELQTRLRGRFEGMVSSPGFGNAASVESLVGEVIGRQLDRIHNTGSPQRRQVIPDDLGGEVADSDDFNQILRTFESQFVGLDAVKQRLTAVVNEVHVSIALGSSRPKAPRMLFLGNPGTGKTTAARELSRLLRALGCTATDRFLETRGTELKAGFLGQTKDRVLKAFQDARGGVLLIDEAYALSPPGALGFNADSFALEAIDTLVGQVTLPENAQTVVILSGYPEPMRAFLRTNPGLASRFPDVVEFADYSAIQCLDILRGTLARVEPVWGILPDDAMVVHSLLEAIETARQQPTFGNARSIESLASRIREARNHRLLGLSQQQMREQASLLPSDIQSSLRPWLRHSIAL